VIGERAPQKSTNALFTDYPQMENSTGWQISVVGGLNAHFKQPEGPSKPATEWAVSILSGDDEHRVLVRSYHDDHAGLTQEQVTQKVLQFIANKLQSGWTPSDYQGMPGELTLPPPATKP
jgi:hypothetical protein